jgi:hypothetical protein
MLLMPPLSLDLCSMSMPQPSESAPVMATAVPPVLRTLK